MAYPAMRAFDYAVPVGTPVRAAHDGQVLVYHGSPTYGDYVALADAECQTLYAHLSATQVRTGEEVRAGDPIGLSGNTGHSTGPHLHFGLRPIPTNYANGYKGWVDPEPYIEEGRLLTTLHFQRVPDWANGVLADWRTGWAKVVNPSAGLSLPDVPRLCARWWTDDRDAQYLREGREGGARFVRDMLPTWRSVAASCYELANEPDCNSNDGLAALNTYTLGAIDEAERNEARLCILNLPEANPSGDAVTIRWKWEQLAPCVRRAIQGQHYVGLHAYWRPGVEGPEGIYHALGRRARDIATLAAIGVDTSRLKVLINECGIDGGIAGHTPQQGWRNLATPETYRAQIVAAEQYARQVPQMQALMYFTAGYEDPWGGYDIDEGFARSLTEPLRALGGTLPVQPLEPEVSVGISENELAQARQRLAVLPATMKACDARGWVWHHEWSEGGRVYALAWNPYRSTYVTLRLNPQTWAVEAEREL